MDGLVLQAALSIVCKNLQGLEAFVALLRHRASTFDRPTDSQGVAETLPAHTIHEHNLVESLEFETKEVMSLSLASPLQRVLPGLRGKGQGIGPGHLSMR